MARYHFYLGNWRRKFRLISITLPHCFICSEIFTSTHPVLLLCSCFGTLADTLLMAPISNRKIKLIVRLVTSSAFFTIGFSLCRHTHKHTQIYIQVPTFIYRHHNYRYYYYYHFIIVIMIINANVYWSNERADDRLHDVIISVESFSPPS